MSPLIQFFHDFHKANLTNLQMKLISISLAFLLELQFRVPWSKYKKTKRKLLSQTLKPRRQPTKRCNQPGTPIFKQHFFTLSTRNTLHSLTYSHKHFFMSAFYLTFTRSKDWNKQGLKHQPTNQQVTFIYQLTYSHSTLRRSNKKDSHPLSQDCDMCFQLLMFIMMSG